MQVIIFHNALLKYCGNSTVIILLFAGRQIPQIVCSLFLGWTIFLTGTGIQLKTIYKIKKDKKLFIKYYKQLS